MADSKISELSNLKSPKEDHRLLVVDTDGDKFVSKQITFGNLKSSVANTLTQNVTSNTTDSTVIASFQTSRYRSGEFLVQATNANNNNVQLTKGLTLHYEGDNALLTIYGSISSNGNIANYSANTSNGNLNLIATPLSNNTINFVTRKILVEV